MENKRFFKRMIIGVVITVSFCIFIPSSFARSVDEAVQWAEDLVGEKPSLYFMESGLTFCQRFVAYAYGNGSGVFGSAKLAWESDNGVLGDVFTSNEFDKIPRGALVFFNSDLVNGHVGLCVGGGEMIHVWPSKIQKHAISFQEDHYLGWRWPISWTSDVFDAIEVFCEDLKENHSRIYAELDLANCREVKYYINEDYQIYEIYVQIACYSDDGLALTPGICYRFVRFKTRNGAYGITDDCSSNCSGLGGDDISVPTSNPFISSTDIHITHCKIRPYKEGSWHNEVDVDMTAGETYDIEMEVRIRNKSNHDLENIDVDYLVVKDKKDFNPDKRYRLEDEDADIDEGEKDSKHSGRIRVSVSEDFSTITVSGQHSFSFPITEQNIREKEITLYFHTDIETENGKDRDLSDEFSFDEYGKLEIHLDIIDPPIANFIPTPATGEAPLTVSFENTSKNAEEWNWNFGDDTTSREYSPVHFYENPGKYEVVLMISNYLFTVFKVSTVVVVEIEPIVSIEDPGAIEDEVVVKEFRKPKKPRKPRAVRESRAVREPRETTVRSITDSTSRDLRVTTDRKR